MDNFRKFESRKRPTSSVDGLVSGPSPRGMLINKSYSGRDRNSANDSKIDQFKRGNGFHGVKQAALSSNARAAGLSGNSASKPAHGNFLDKPETTRGTKTKKKGKLKKILKRSMLTGLLLFLMAGTYFGVKLYFTSKHVFSGTGSGAPALSSNVDVSSLNGEGDGRINILLIGKGGVGHPGGELTDTMLLASIDPTQKQLALLSIPRDLWVKNTGTNTSIKLNAAYELGKEKSSAKTDDGKQADGMKALFDTLSPIIGVPIHYYVSFDFGAYKQVVDTVGGVDIHLDNAIFDPNFDWQYGANALKLPAGDVHLNGTQALLLGRARGAAGGYGLATDFDRNTNQRKMLFALRDKILSSGTYSNPVKVNSLISTLGTHMRTSFSSVGELLRLYQIVQTIPATSIASLDLVTPPNDLLTTSNIAGNSVVIPKAGVDQYADLQNYVRNAMKDGFLVKESANIAVYNDTSVTGLASKQGNVLKSFGYTVMKVADAPGKTNGQKTIVIDLTGGAKKYTKHYLEQRYKTTAVSTIPNPKITADGADFVIIIGQDAINTP